MLLFSAKYQHESVIGIHMSLPSPLLHFLNNTLNYLSFKIFACVCVCVCYK